MDEPTKALDPVTAHTMRNLIRDKVVGERKKTVLYATHNLQEAEGMSDRLAIINKGSLQYVGTVEALKKKFQHDIRYIIRVRNPENDLIRKIASVYAIEKISGDSSGVSPESVQFEIMPDTNGEGISHIIGEIIKMGGNIASLQEKEPTLEEVFSKVVLE